MINSVFILLIILNLVVLIINQRILQVGSDHAFHIRLINEIRNNRHRFLKKSFLISEINFAYPQLFHLVLSFLPKKMTEKNAEYISVVINQIPLFLLLLYVKYLISSLDSMYYLNKTSIFLMIGLLFLFTPFTWSMWNAKNTGISARGIGIVLSYVYQFFMLSDVLHGDMNTKVMILVLAFVILTSSQFAFQFVLLSAPIYAFAFKNMFYMMIPCIACVIFIILLPNVAISFIKGQFWHKFLYSKYIIKIHNFKNRPSIWRDLIYDFWIKLFKTPKKFLNYVYTNSIISIVLLMPISIFVVAGYYDYSKWLYFNKYEYFFVIQVLIGLICFVFTSFRWTRFLGEPERYVELVLPFMVILFMLKYSNTMLIYYVLAYSIFITILQFGIVYYNNKKMKISSVNRIDSIYEKILFNCKCDSFEMFSNNIDILKFFLQYEKCKILKPNLTSLKTGSLTFNDVFKEQYPNVAKESIYSLINEFRINVFILDTSLHVNIADIKFPDSVHYRKIGEDGNLSIYEIRYS